MADVSLDITGNISPQKEESFVPNLSVLQFPDGGISAPVVNAWVQQRRQNIRPWATFFNSANFRTPPTLTRLTKRVLSNIEYFKSNYLFVYIGLVLYCLITSPLLLLAVAVSAGAGYLLTLRSREGRKVVLLGRELPLGQQYGLVAICSLPIFYWAGAGAALFWVLGASCFLIGLHAAFYNIDNLLFPEGEQFGLEQV